MRNVLLLFVPIALFAQVQVETIIRLPRGSDRMLSNAAYLPELNKLYAASEPDRYYVIDCSTYRVVDSISDEVYGEMGHAWNWRRLKLYALGRNMSDSILAIDAAADTVIRWLHFCSRMPSMVYLSDVDRLYKAAVETLYAFDGATDSVVRRATLGGVSTNACWDSAGRKLYVEQGGDKQLYVYDYVADSVLKVIDVSRVSGVQPDALLFNNSFHKAYVAPFQGEPGPSNVGIIDTERDTLVGTLPVRIWGGLYGQAAVDERDDKVYFADENGSADSDTMWVVDCATDSVRKKVDYSPDGGTWIVRWVPWSNRVYQVTTASLPYWNSCIKVLDCNTDSFIVKQMLVNHAAIRDIQLDPIRQRIFVVGVDTNDIYVLRDTGYGIAEAKQTEPRVSSGLQVRTMPGWFDVLYFLASPSHVDLSVYDLTGREVRRLVGEDQTTGQHSAVWNCTNRNGAAIAHGVYFIRLDAPGRADVTKVVMTR
ncbi:MAG TPA: FlgD immunoglobulin-like domain containing protein [bacterium]|nr:FlgD immunoglobulin-like domain containing protein [bacterium]